MPFPRLSAYGYWSFLIGGIFVIGSVLFDPTTGMPKFDMDKNSDNLAIKYSCAALDLASSAAPVQTLSWIALHR